MGKMRKFKFLCVVVVFIMAYLMMMPTVAKAAKSSGTVKNSVKVLMEYSDGSTVAIPEAKVGVEGGLLGTKFLLGSKYHVCDDKGETRFKQTSRITDMYFELPEAWADKVDGARAEYRAKLIGNFRYHNYKSEIKNNRFRVGMPLAWTSVDTTIYIKAKSFDVVFNDGESSDILKVEYLKKVEKPDDPKKVGYTFKGWFNSEEEFNFETPITENIKLTAKWEINKYIVTFDSGVDAQTVEHGSKANKPSDPEKEGYTFLAWYNGEEKFDFDTPITADITLTARWEKKKYTVDFMSDESQIASYEVEHGNTVAVPDVELAKEGWIFRGWFGAENKEFNPNTPITSNLILTAKWVVDTRIGSAKVNFYVYNELSMGEMYWDAKYFIPVEVTGAYISNADELINWQVEKKHIFARKHYYIKGGDIPANSKLYDEDMLEIDVKGLAKEDLNSKMSDTIKSKLTKGSYELRIYRFTKVDDENIHVDLAFCDTNTNEWLHNQK